jgi:hypothetical protein
VSKTVGGSGSMILTLYALALATIAGIAVWFASARWWHALIIAVMWVPFFPPVARWLTGDISAYLPGNAFSEGARGKDEFIWASIYATVMIAVIAAAVLWWIITQTWQLTVRQGKGNPPAQGEHC